MKTLLLIISTFALEFVGQISAAYAHQICCVSVGHSVAVGKLSSKVVYGPPNYGEDPQSDSKEKIYLVRLDRSCFRKGALKGSARGSLQLVGEKVIGAERYVGRWVIIRGNVFAAETGHHHTPFVLDVSDIKQLGSR